MRGLLVRPVRLVIVVVLVALFYWIGTLVAWANPGVTAVCGGMRWTTEEERAGNQNR